MSESPLWKERIEQRWLPRIPESFVVPNWSTRHDGGSGTWLAWRLHRLFVGSEREYCPVVIVLRGYRFPMIFRFFRAFKEHAQGRGEALEVLEGRLFDTLANEA